MSDLHLMFIRQGRVLLPLLGVFIVVCVAGVVLRDYGQAQMIFSIVSMLFSVGVTLYALDFPIRFFVLGEDRLFHLSPSPRAATAIKAALVSVIYLLVLFFVGRAAQLLTSEAPVSSWGNALGGGLVQKLASLVCAFALVLVISALAKPLRGRIAQRAVSWLCFCMVVAALAAVFIVWATDPSRALSWGIGTLDQTTVSVYAGLLPVLVPDTSSLGAIVWQWCALDAGIAVAAIVVFLALCRWRPMNFLAS